MKNTRATGQRPTDKKMMKQSPRSSATIHSYLDTDTCRISSAHLSLTETRYWSKQRIDRCKRYTYHCHQLLDTTRRHSQSGTSKPTIKDIDRKLGSSYLCHEMVHQTPNLVLEPPPAPCTRHLTPRTGTFHSKHIADLIHFQHHQ